MPDHRYTHRFELGQILEHHTVEDLLARGQIG
jgi:hypothetical protein